jgi:2-C-methyl-D-erythritol 4-phosphate cytidylyltransferase / 2-C-methyl-D-erythritol 2,4-cyclodiphosphate synthase
MSHCAVLIVAAGNGERLGGPLPKQYRPLGGRAMLRWSIEAFLACPRVDSVVVAIHPDHRALYDRAAAGLALAEPVTGAGTRQATVRAGLERLSADPPDRVLIHDAARPLIDAATIERVLDALDSAPAAIAAIPVVDTLKRGVDGMAVATVDRGGLWQAQTPQGFDFRTILAAHRQAASQSLTDDAAVAEQAGHPVRLVTGHADNFKVTTEDDLDRAERLVSAAAETRVGQGFDVHRFAPGDAIVLCGIAVPHTARLEGHSDADVGLHALTDALLGAIAQGDIGEHFPPSEPRWRGADSAAFLRHAAGLVRARGTIVNVDVTLICEAPKVAPHRRAMVARVAELLDLEPDRVSVKATTTEGLGFAGRREGIAAQAAATVRLRRQP